MAPGRKQEAARDPFCPQPDIDPVKPLKLLAAVSSLADVAAQHTDVVGSAMYLSVLVNSPRLSMGAIESSGFGQYVRDNQLVQLYAAAACNCLELLLSSAAPGQQQAVPADALNVISILCESLARCLTQHINSVPPGEQMQLGRRLAQQVWEEGVKSTLADACCMAAVALEDRKEQQQQRQQQQAKQQPQQSASAQQQEEEAAAAKPISAADLSFALLRLWCSVAGYLGSSDTVDVDAVQHAFLRTSFGPVGKLAAVVLAAWQPLSASSGSNSSASGGSSGSSSSSARSGVDLNGVFWGTKVGTLDQAVHQAAHVASVLAVLTSSGILRGMIEKEPALQQQLVSDELLQLLALTTAHAAHRLHAACAGKCAVSPTGEAAVQLSVPAHHKQLLQAVGGQWVGREGFKEQWRVETTIRYAVCASISAICDRYAVFTDCSGSSSSSSATEEGSSSSVLQSSQPQQEQQAGVVPACVVPAHLQLPWLRVLLEVALLATSNGLQDIPMRVQLMDNTLELITLLVMVMWQEAEPATAAAGGAAAGPAAEGSTATPSAPGAAAQSGTSTAAEAPAGPAGPAAPHAAAPAAAGGATGLRLPSATAAGLLAPVLRLLAPAVLHVLKQSEPGGGRGEPGGSSAAQKRLNIMEHFSSLLTTLCLSVEPKHLATACFNQAEPSAILVSCTMLESSLRAQAGGLRPQQQHLAWSDSTATGQQLPLASSIARACDGPNVQQQLAAAAVKAAAATAAAGAVGMVALENEVFALLLSSLKCVAAAAASSADPLHVGKDCWKTVVSAASAAYKLLEGNSAARATANTFSSSSGGSSNSSGSSSNGGGSRSRDSGNSSSRPAAESSAAPWLVIIARGVHVAGQHVTQLAQRIVLAPDAAKLPAAELFTHIVRKYCVLVINLIGCLSAGLPLVSEEQAASGWTSASGRALGVPQLLLQQLQEQGKQLADALQPDCWPSSSSSSSSSQHGLAELAAVAADLGQQMQAFGEAVSAQLPLRLACNVPGCVNLSKTSEMQLVGGKGSVCGGCGEARYCGQQCQLAHWKQHKPVCQRLKGGGGGRGSGSGENGSEHK